MKDIINKTNNIMLYNTLRKLGLRPSHTGTVLIFKAVQIMKKQNYDIIVMQDIYNTLSKEYVSFTVSYIKRSIKYAIDNRNEQKSIDNFKSIFGYDYDEELFTNKNFIEEIYRII